MNRMRVSNAVSDGNKYTLRIVSDEYPENDAVSVPPTLEDVCIYYFGEDVYKRQFPDLTPKRLLITS